MAQLIPGLEGVNWFPIIGQIVYWMSIILGSIVAFSVMVILWYLSKFRIKATVFPMYGSGTDGVFSFGKQKNNRVRWINKQTGWKSLYPIGNKKEREPFDSEYIYPGNKIFIFELNQEWIPGRININKTENELRADINPVPYYVRNWQSLEYKKNEVEYSKLGFWEENKAYIIMMVTVLACCVLVGAVIYFTYQFAGGGRADVSAITQAIEGITTIQGKVPI